MRLAHFSLNATCSDLLVNIINDIVTAGTTIAIAVVISYGLTRAIKRTELRVGFSERWVELMARIHDINRSAREHRDVASPLQTELALMDAKEGFRSLFTLMYDEFVSYQDGFLEKRIFTQWMTYNMDLARAERDDGGYRIGPLSYLEGWQSYKDDYPFVDKAFKDFLDGVHAAGRAAARDANLKRLVAADGPGLFGTGWFRPHLASHDQIRRSNPSQ